MDSHRGVAFDGRVAGAGPLIVMIPSLGRSGADFDRLAAALREHGYSTLPLSGRIVATDSEQSFADIADAVAAVCAGRGAGPRYLLGHAYGQTLARCIVARHPGAFAALMLLACGESPPGPRVQPSTAAANDDELARTKPSVHLAHVARSFFAPGNDPSAWAGGWDGELAAVERETMRRTPSDVWRSAGLARTLVIQGVQDVVAPPENGRSFARRVGASLLEVDGAGHALLPEQPHQVAAAVIDFLNRTTAQISGGPATISGSG